MMTNLYMSSLIDLKWDRTRFSSLRSPSVRPEHQWTYHWFSFLGALRFCWVGPPTGPAGLEILFGSWKKKKTTQILFPHFSFNMCCSLFYFRFVLFLLYLYIFTFVCVLDLCLIYNCTYIMFDSHKRRLWIHFTGCCTCISKHVTK